MEKQSCIICDLDNVYFDSREWNKLIPKSNTREAWNDFQREVYLCIPNSEIVSIITQLSELIPILFVTGREDTGYLKDKTINQIQNSCCGLIGIGATNKLFMRKEADYRPAHKVKEEILKREILKKYRPVLAIDDDINIIKMYNKYDIDTWHYTKFIERKSTDA